MTHMTGISFNYISNEQQKNDLSTTYPGYVSILLFFRAWRESIHWAFGSGPPWESVAAAVQRANA